MRCISKISASNKRDLLRNTQPCLTSGCHSAYRRRIVVAEHTIRSLLVLQQLLHSLVSSQISTLFNMLHRNDILRRRLSSVLRQRLLVPLQAIQGRAQVSSTDMSNPFASDIDQ